MLLAVRGGSGACGWRLGRTPRRCLAARAAGRFAARRSAASRGGRGGRRRAATGAAIPPRGARPARAARSPTSATRSAPRDAASVALVLVDPPAEHARGLLRVLADDV